MRHPAKITGDIACSWASQAIDTVLACMLTFVASWLSHLIQRRQEGRCMFLIRGPVRAASDSISRKNRDRKRPGSG